MSGELYRTYSRILHRFNLHHTRDIGPLEDGVILTRCDWCGISGTFTPIEVIEARMREALQKPDCVWCNAESNAWGRPVKCGIHE